MKVLVSILTVLFGLNAFAKPIEKERLSQVKAELLADAEDIEWNCNKVGDEVASSEKMGEPTFGDVSIKGNLVITQLGFVSEQDAAMHTMTVTRTKTGQYVSVTGQSFKKATITKGDIKDFQYETRYVSTSSAACVPEK